jgi:hypothetical protein
MRCKSSCIGGVLGVLGAHWVSVGYSICECVVGWI